MICNRRLTRADSSATRFKAACRGEPKRKLQTIRATLVKSFSCSDNNAEITLSNYVSVTLYKNAIDFQK